MEIDHSCPEVMINKKKEEPILERNALLAVLVDRMEPIQIFQHRPYTCIQVRTWYNDREYTTFGFSCVKDSWDEDRAADVAIKEAILMAYVQIRSNERAVNRQKAYASLLEESKRP